MTEVNPARRILLTDHPWAGVEVERPMCASMGFELVEAPKGATLQQLIDLALDTVGIITCWSQVPSELINASSRLRVISRLGVGVDNIDVAAAHQRGIVVTRVPDYCVEEVSDHAVALTLALARGVAFFNNAVQHGTWDPGSFTPRRVREMTIGILGSGRNGIRTAEKFAALGCRVYVDDRHRDRVPSFGTMSFGEILMNSDVVSLHLPLTEANRNIVDDDALGRMREGAYLVNTSRGGLIDVDALVRALDAGRLGGAALDVLPNEPDVPPSLLGRDNVIITPHVAFSSAHSVDELRRRTVEDHLRAQRGETPEHQV